jgi:hypothetical protein
MRAYRLALLIAYFAVLTGSTNIAWAQVPAVGTPQERIVSREEFYYYDANKLRIPLNLSRSVAVRFRTTKTADEKAQFLKDLSPTSVREIAPLYARTEFALDFMPTQNQDARTATFKKLSAVQDIEATPIFTVDGMDAVTDGIYLQTVTPMSRDTVAAALQKYFGNVGIQEITPEGNVWHVTFTSLFFLDGERLSLTVLSIANLIQTSDAFVWVKRAYPKFAFLNQPVIPSLSVYPLSGTVGEQRTVVVGFRIFGKTSSDVVIDESDIPEFLQGSFVPKANDKPPQTSFVEAIGAVQKEDLRQVGPNEWYFEHRYTFGLYAPEPDWVFPSFKIPYTYRGVRKEMELPVTTFFVRPHLDSKNQIADIPSAFQIPLPNFLGLKALPPIDTTAWFDPLAARIGGRKNVVMASEVMLGSSAVMAFAFIGVLAFRGFSRAWPRRERRGITQVRLAALLKSAEEEPNNRKSLQAYHKALSEVFHSWDPQFSRGNLTYQDVRSRLGSLVGRGDLIAHLERSVGLEELFDEIESRNDPAFDFRDENDLKALGTNLRLKIEKLAEELELQTVR